jgi:phosphoglucomutase
MLNWRGGKPVIRFGTSGWRAVISDEFTFANVRRVTRAVAGVVSRHTGKPARLAIGYDTRFLSERFAAEAAKVLTEAGGPTYLSGEPLPTPVLAFAITHLGLDGGLNVTASHNPPEYNGLKFSTAQGAPAPREITDQIEAQLVHVSQDPVADQHAELLSLAPREAYFARLRELVDVDALRARPLRVGFDARFGTSRGWLDRFLEENGATVVRVNDRRDPLFGGGTPECSGANLNSLKQVVTAEGLDLGLATDGDGDRFGVVDSDGKEMSPNMILALLADDLLRTRAWAGGIGRTVATTHLLDRIGALHGRELYETPVGFKHFQSLMEKGAIFMGGEESAGFSVAGHVPEKDGILAGLLVAELVARRGPDLSAHLRTLFAEIGPLYSQRRDRRFDPESREVLESRLKEVPASLAGESIQRTVSIDGTKWIREDGAWLMVRLSGTEPVVRLYAEAADETTVTHLLDQGEALLP